MVQGSDCLSSQGSSSQGSSWVRVSDLGGEGERRGSSNGCRSCDQVSGSVGWSNQGSGLVRVQESWCLEVSWGSSDGDRSWGSGSGEQAASGNGSSSDQDGLVDHRSRGHFTLVVQGSCGGLGLDAGFIGGDRSAEAGGVGDVVDR